MPSITILTDSAAQFIHPTFPGKELVQVIALSPVEQSGQSEFRLGSKPDREIQSMFLEASQASSSVIAIFSSGCLSALPGQVLRLFKDTSTVQRLIMIDSLNIGIGTGFLVEKAASMAVKGLTGAEIEQEIREACNTIYTTVILPDLYPLVPIGLVDAAQANAASILGIQSIFSMEDGLPTPLIKTRTMRSACEYMVEFIDEFERFHLLATVDDDNIGPEDRQIITDHLNEFFPGTALEAYVPNAGWKIAFGEKSSGFVVISNESNF